MVSLYLSHHTRMSVICLSSPPLSSSLLLSLLTLFSSAAGRTGPGQVPDRVLEARLPFANHPQHLAEPHRRRGRSHHRKGRVRATVQHARHGTVIHCDAHLCECEAVGYVPFFRAFLLRIHVSLPLSPCPSSLTTYSAQCLGTLCMYGCQIQSLERLAPALADCRRLLEVDLSWNRFGPKGSQHIASSWIGRPESSVRHLNIAHNKVSDEGTCAIVRTSVQLSSKRTR